MRRPALVAAFCSLAQSLVPTMPGPGGSVYAIEKIGGTVYIGGGFTAVNGRSQLGIAMFDLVTGALEPALPGGCYGVLVSTADGVWSGRVMKE